MNPALWPRAKEIFSAALLLAEGDRNRFVAASSEGLPELRVLVDQMLQDDREAERADFLADPPSAFQELMQGPTNPDGPGWLLSGGRPQGAGLAPGDLLANRYRIESLIARGGMGEVYRATDLELAVPIALKTIRREISSDPASLDRFKQEVLLARSVSHPNVCRIFDLGRDDSRDVSFLTMEFLSGGTLASRIHERGTLEPAEVLALIAPLAGALDAAHRAGVVHRDLKSANVMLVPDETGERAVVTDFGLAVAVGEEGGAAWRGPDAGPSAGRAAMSIGLMDEARGADFPSLVANSRASEDSDGGTVLGRFPDLSSVGQEPRGAGADPLPRIYGLVGTPAYMSPEQVMGGRVGPASDLYALGVMIYEMSTGRLPFRGSSPLETARAQITREAPAPSLFAPVDPRWERVILRLLSKNPSERYASAREVVLALEAVLDGAEGIPVTVPSRSSPRTRLTRMRPLLISLLGLGVAATIGTAALAHHRRVEVSFSGPAKADRFGTSVADAGDVNWDGYQDLVVGAPEANHGAGAVYVYLGGHREHTEPDVILEGEPKSRFGWAVASAGDVNGDGRTDIIVGAFSYGADTGRAYIFFGGAWLKEKGRIIDASHADVILTGEAKGDLFGYSVATAGDVNRDGRADVIVGACDHDAFIGRAYLFYGGSALSGARPAGSADVILTGEEREDRFGISVASAGDVNADGNPDLIIGACGHDHFTGRAYVFLGGQSLRSKEAAGADVILNGEQPNDNFGTSVSAAGDMNGDRFTDLIVGAPGYADNTGRAYVFYGGRDRRAGNAADADVILTGETSRNDFGYSVASAGDVDGDGRGDVIVGGYGFQSNTGRAYVFLARPGLKDENAAAADRILTGKGRNTLFGISVCRAGSAYRDGFHDVFVGAWGNDSGPGRAYVHALK